MLVPDPILAEFLLAGGATRTMEELFETYQASSLEEVQVKQQAQLETLPKLAKLYATIELPLAAIIADMKVRGIYIDQDRLAKVTTTLTEKRIELSTAIHDQLGDMNLNSPKQLGDALVTHLKITLPKTKTGQSSTGYDILQPLAVQYPLIAQILDFRAVDKILGTYIDPLTSYIGDDGRIHPYYIQTAAATGRLACKDPNIQSTPILGEYGALVRSYYTAAPGASLVGCDYSQQELRILAHLSKDEKLIEAFEKNIDVHVVTASEILGIPLDKVTKKERSIGKTLNFGIVYGETSFGLSRQLGKSRAECDAILRRYFETYAGVKRYFDNLLTSARIHGRVETLYGRQRGILGKKLGETAKFLTGEQERILKNFPIQGSAADMTKAAMVKVAHEVLPQYPKASLIMQIHDELIFEYTSEDRGEVAEFQKAAVSAMQNAVQLSVPVVVTSSIGIRWSELK